MRSHKLCLRLQVSDRVDKLLLRWNDSRVVRMRDKIRCVPRGTRFTDAILIHSILLEALLSAS